MGMVEGTCPGEPWPDRILDDFGFGFAFGGVSGSAYHFLKGVCNSPNGTRFRGGGQAVRTNAPRVGGSFAFWWGLLSVIECAMVQARQKEDPWNRLIACTATGGLNGMRQGLGSASVHAACGAVVFLLLQRADTSLDSMKKTRRPSQRPIYRQQRGYQQRWRSQQ